MGVPTAGPGVVCSFLRKFDACDSRPNPVSTNFETFQTNKTFQIILDRTNDDVGWCECGADRDFPDVGGGESEWEVAKHLYEARGHIHTVKGVLEPTDPLEGAEIKQHKKEFFAEFFGNLKSLQD